MRRIFFCCVPLLICGAAIATLAQTPDALTGTEIRGRQLARQLLEQRPAESFTNAGVLEIRGPHDQYSEVPVQCEVIAPPGNSNWETVYRAGTTNAREILVVIHRPDRANEYFYWTNSTGAVPVLTGVPAPGHLFAGHRVAGAELMKPFAGSDFWIADLGLEFFHWPDQDILRGETMRGRFCKVLQSTNPHPPPNGYSRVVSWIDNESLGIVQAKAYSAGGKLLKDFFPKDIKKVNGQWEVGSMLIENIQTGSRTWIKFNLNAH